MSHLSQNLERLIQMMSIEQLIGLLKQTNNINSTNNTTNNDILLSPIVQKVVQEYEQEIKELKANVSQGTNVSQSTNNEVPIVKDYSDDIAKIHKQLEAINTNLLSLADTIKNITQVNSINHVNSEIVTPIPITPEPTKSAPITIISGENIRLNIEEKINVDDKEEVDVEDEELEVEEEELEEEELEEEEEVKVDDKNICSICECKVILDEDIVVIDGKNYCGACDPSVLQEEELEEEEVEESEEEVSDKEEEVVDNEEEEVSEKEISDDEEEVEVSDKEQEEEQQVTNEDEEVFEIEIDDITYYATHEENGILYAVEKDGDVGPQVGIIKDGEPIFS